MSTSGDSYITKDDIVGYLEERQPAEFEDPELEHYYDMMQHHWDRHLEQINGEEYDLDMAKNYLEQAWILEDERQK